MQSVGFAAPTPIAPAWADCAAGKIGAWMLTDPRGKVAKLAYLYHPVATDDVFVNDRKLIRDLARRIREAGSVPELECYEVGHVDEALALVKEGLLTDPLHFQFVLGIPGGIGARKEVLEFLVTQVPANATWGVAAVGRHQRPMTELAIELGGHARLGLEDNIYLETGVLSEGSAPLVARAAAFARSLGRTVAEPSRARQLLGLRR